MNEVVKAIFQNGFERIHHARVKASHQCSPKNLSPRVPANGSKHSNSRQVRACIATRPQISSISKHPSLASARTKYCGIHYMSAPRPRDKRDLPGARSLARSDSGSKCEPIKKHAFAWRTSAAARDLRVAARQGFLRPSFSFLMLRANKSQWLELARLNVSKNLGQ